MSEALSTPETRPGFRDAEYTRNIVLRMGEDFITALDRLGEVNQRSRREIVEILVAEAFDEFENNKDARILPFTK
jgi:Spy/CpxP family protein refolding chaperone